MSFLPVFCCPFLLHATPVSRSVSVESEDYGGGPDVLVLETSSSVVVSGRIPETPARDPYALVLVLSDGDLSDDFVTRDVELRLDLHFNLIGNAFG